MPSGTKIAPTISQLQEKLTSLIPSYELPLPAFSAKKKEGKRLYQLARKGEEIHETKLMNIHGYEILDYQFPLLKLRLDVGSGTYIRSIGHRLGEEFGLGGILAELRRTRIGKWNIQNPRDNAAEVDYHMRGQVGSFWWREIQE